MNFTGSIKFDSVTFNYPSRPTVKVLDQFSFHFKPHHNYGIVGSSGCGKSTIFQLIQRLYDPQEGNIFVEIYENINPTEKSSTVSQRILNTNGNNGQNNQLYQKQQQNDRQINNGFDPEENYNNQNNQNQNLFLPSSSKNQEENFGKKWVNLKDIYVGPWRKYCVGLVTQEPPILPGTIADNIRLGAPHSSTEDIIAASILSNSHEFILKKKDHYNFYLNGPGTLSGGQAQRIGIARAALMKPALLLLDEYTSALDYKTEGIVSQNIAAMRQGIWNQGNTNNGNEIGTQIVVNDENNGQNNENNGQNNENNGNDENLFLKTSYSDNKTLQNTNISNGHLKGTITIAHRLVTVRNSLILGMKDGKLSEFGTHSELLLQYPDGVYAQMFNAHPDPSLTGALKEIHGENNENNKKNSNFFKIQAKKEINLQNITIRPSNFIKSTDKHLQDQKKSTSVTRSARKLQFTPLIKHIFVSHPIMMIISLLSIALSGASFPVFSYIFGHALKALYEPNVEEMKRGVTKYAVYFVLFAAVAALNTFFMYSILGVVAEKVINYFRTALYTNLIAQEMAFFDQETNSTGILTTKLAKDTTQIRLFITQFFQQCLSFISQLCITFGMCYYSSPTATLVMCLLFPISALGSYLHFRFVRGFAGTSKEHLEGAGSIAITSMKNFRVIASFNVENWTCIQFSQLNDDALWTGMVSGLYSGFGYGLSQFCFYLASALIYWFGGKLVIDETLSFNDFFQISQSMRFVSQQLSMILGQMSNLDAMNAAISDMYDLMNRKTLENEYLFDNCMETANKNGQNGKNDEKYSPITRGRIEFKNVKFHYPTTRNLPLLKGISFDTNSKRKDKKNSSLIEKNNKNEISSDDDNNYVLALVGGSGNGKSTIMNLLLQFYQTIQPGGNSRLIAHKKSEYINKFIRPKWEKEFNLGKFRDETKNEKNNNKNKKKFSSSSSSSSSSSQGGNDFTESLLNSSNNGINGGDIQQGGEGDMVLFIDQHENYITSTSPSENSPQNGDKNEKNKFEEKNNKNKDENFQLSSDLELKKVEDMSPFERHQYQKLKQYDFEHGGDLRDPEEAGMILIDGIDIMSIPLSELYKKVSFVPQQPQIFASTVLDNIRCGDETISLERVQESCKKAQIHSIIMKLPQGYDTEIDSKKLSTGQKQRLCIARAIVRDPAILCLDEASSGLDAVNSKKVHLALEKAMIGKVTLTIAHRLETIAAADNILVLDRGEIVESGSHEELLEQSRLMVENGKQQGVYAAFLENAVSQ